MKSPAALLLLLVVCACSAARLDAEEHATATFPVKLAAEPGAARNASPPSDSRLPDPPPQSVRDHYELLLMYTRGEIEVSKVTALHFDEATEGTRRAGRFALELWDHDTLLQRLHFDFPLLAAERPDPDAERPLHRTPLFGPGAQVSTTVRVPALPRTTRAQIVDRASDTIKELPWPPQVSKRGAQVQASDGGLPAKSAAPK
jgi:hypothetical protein